MSEISKDPGEGRNYWRSLQELADSEEFRLQLENEFPGGIEAPEPGMSRRRFLQIMSASIAMTSLAGCRWPEEKIVPFVAREAGVTPGTPLRFATSMELGSQAFGVVATSYDGRPIRIDGNPDFALSGGAVSAMAQASVLDLYDPDRSREIVRRQGGRMVPADWAAFTGFARDRCRNGAGVAVLAPATTSPSVHGLLERMAGSGADLFRWEPVCRRNEIRGAGLALGNPAKALLDLTQARVIVDFDANLLQDHPTALRNSRQFAAGRDAESGHMNRLYVYENSFTITGGMADHRFPTPASHIGAAVWALAAELVLGEGLPLPAGAGLDRTELAKWRGHAAASGHVSALAKDLMANRGGGLLVAGIRQDESVHALIHVLNRALGNAGHAISYLPVSMPPLKTIRDLVVELNAGRVQTLIVLGGNPAYDAPADLDFPAAMQKAPERIHLGTHRDETAKHCTWHVPQAHYLESWGDAAAWDDTYLAVQPLIEPLFGGRTPAELLSAIVDEAPRNAYAVARDGFHARGGGRGPAPVDDPGFEKKWRAFIHQGFLDGSGREKGEVPALAGASIAPPRPADLDIHNLEISFAQDQSVYDGRFANNAWLQEMPDFMSKLTWDNAALLGPATAAELGVRHGDLVQLEYEGRWQEAAVYILPGQAPHSVTLNLGYGRTEAGKVAQGAGFNAYALRTWDALDGGPGLKVHATGRTYKLATTQDHHAIDTSGAQEIQRRVPSLVREGTLDQYAADEHFVDHLGIHHPPLESLWKEREYEGYKWGMAIDLNKCTGCNACLIGCQAENNIPVVGKDEVRRGREMAWLRLDRYFLGDMEDPACTQQPVGCVQCELAPCEQVCPVAATMHTDEGLNAMVYNRCVGTRYCSNNCPYKVRRFNWFNNFENLTETQRLVLNPDVTVRSRGVMEKCTYCVQRIEGARVQARVEGRGIEDGDITTACQQVCPTDAIVFGDLNDEHSRVSRLREVQRSYDLLGYLNVKPRTFYMARIRNPNPEITPPDAAGGHGAGHGGDGGHDAEEGHGTQEGQAHG